MKWQKQGLWFNWNRPPPSVPPVDRAAADRWLKMLRDDPWYQVEPVPTNSAAFVGVIGIDDRDMRRKVTGRSRHSLSRDLAARILAVAAKIENGEIVFRRERTGGRGQPPAVAYYLIPPAHRPRLQRPLLLHQDYDWWGRCSCCHGRRFAPVMIGRDLHAACWTCCPPFGYRALGARPSPARLVARWLPSLYH